MVELAFTTHFRRQADWQLRQQSMSTRVGRHESETCMQLPSFQLRLSLRATHRRDQGYENAQLCADGRRDQREHAQLRLSMDASYFLKTLCILIAVCVECLCTGDAGVTHLDGSDFARSASRRQNPKVRQERERDASF